MDGFRNLSSYVLLSTRTDSETLCQVMCLKARGRIPKIFFKLFAGNHAGGFRTFAPSYEDGQDRSTPVTKHHETTQYKSLEVKFHTLARSQQMELRDKFQSSTLQGRGSRCQLNRKHGGHCCQTITYELSWNRRGAVAYPGILFGGEGLVNKFSWGQRTERTEIWGR